MLDYREWSIEFKTTPDPAHFSLTKGRLSVQSSEHYGTFHTIVPLKTDMLFTCLHTFYHSLGLAVFTLRWSSNCTDAGPVLVPLRNFWNVN